MKKVLCLLGVVFVVLVALNLNSCARLSDRISSKGSLIGSTKAPYIIVNQSGGKIMDVYKLTSAIVQSPDGSDGWLFLDNNGNPVYLGGDVKTIRLKNTYDEMWAKYHEYHMEDEVFSYREMYAK